MTTAPTETDAVALINTEKNKALLSQVLEAKLTRTELMDLIIEQISTDLRTERDAILKKLEELEPHRTLKLPAALALLKQAPDTVSVTLQKEVNTKWNNDTREYQSNEISYKLKLKVDLPLEIELPKKYVEAQVEHDRLVKLKNEVEGKLSKLKSGQRQARNELVRHALQNTPEGKGIIEAIGTLTESVKEKLLAVPAAPKRLRYGTRH